MSSYNSASTEHHYPYNPQSPSSSPRRRFWHVFSPRRLPAAEAISLKERFKHRFFAPSISPLGQAPENREQTKPTPGAKVAAGNEEFNNLPDVSPVAASLKWQPQRNSLSVFHEHARHCQTRQRQRQRQRTYLHTDPVPQRSLFKCSLSTYSPCCCCHVL